MHTLILGHLTSGLSQSMILLLLSSLSLFHCTNYSLYHIIKSFLCLNFKTIASLIENFYKITLTLISISSPSQQWWGYHFVKT
jgi:hypothetical protein